jgi:hypothetical protein
MIKCEAKRELFPIQYTPSHQLHKSLKIFSLWTMNSSRTTIGVPLTFSIIPFYNLKPSLVLSPYSFHIKLFYLKDPTSKSSKHINMP